MADISSLEYSVRKIERYVVTRYHTGTNSSGSAAKGEYGNAETAYEVAYALCRAEHDRLGWAPDDMRVCYPSPIGDAACAEAAINPQDTAITQDAGA